ncbi:putative Na+/H+ antiporter [Ferrovum sp. PN-J185]|uniref:putative Na+/H+ antiporter n=1 Tax=Ferrovum sp. PN-J185 TaxID=1356306 RepID=UPI001E410C5E|nr:putative Na+/H+ antiporter [Ferrovum sp. PN-J185]MCC6069230.1 putative Na+/H+ antiporter [Ferrovum sp. PN-J185]
MKLTTSLYLAVFVLALIHTFLASYIKTLDSRFPNYKRFIHLITEIELIFPLWSLVLCLLMLLFEGQNKLIHYLHSLDFTEPLFVIAIMTIAGTKPILTFVENIIIFFVQKHIVKPAISIYFLTLTLLPLLGSFITEPAAMTISAIILKETLFPRIQSEKLRYMMLSVLFVNVSIGGALTPFAAPPILMVANTWHWDMSFMLSTFAIKILTIVVMNTLLGFLLFKKEFYTMDNTLTLSYKKVSLGVVVTHIIFMILVILTSHDLTLFVGILIVFIVFTHIYAIHQERLMLREASFVGLFLTGLILIGSQQTWWLSTALTSLTTIQVYLGATLLTAITDNAALTYLGSLLANPSDEFKLSLVKGAIAGGGLTLIANAPNPIGATILKRFFNQEKIKPFLLLKYALLPTIITLLGLVI